MSDDSSRFDRQITILTVFAFLFGISGFGFFAYGLFLSDSAGSISQIGDFIGGTAGALWTFAGLFLIYLAFLNQQRQLDSQQQEIQILEDQVDQQSAHLERQNFESAFFEMLRNHSALVSSLSSDDVFESFLVRFRAAYNRMLQYAFEDLLDNHDATYSSTPSSSEQSAVFSIIQDIPELGLKSADKASPESHIGDDLKSRLAVESFSRQHQESRRIKIYLRSLKNILMYLDAYGPETSDAKLGKHQYSDLITLQMTETQSLIHYYFCHTGEGADLLSLGAQFGLFVGVKEDNLLDPVHSDLPAPTSLSIDYVTRDPRLFHQFEDQPVEIELTSDGKISLRGKAEEVDQRQ